MGEATTIFSIHDRKDYEIHEIVQQVYDALKEKGYNPVNQLVGYILSEDPTYITTYKNARALIRKVDRDDPCCAIISTFDVSGFFSSAARTRAVEFFVYWWMWAGGGVSPSNVLEVGPRCAALGRDWSPGLFAEKAPPPARPAQKLRAWAG